MPAPMQSAPRNGCSRPEPGTVVSEPRELRSRGGVLKVDLTITNHVHPDGRTDYCYVTPDGSEAPTLRVHPGDEVILRLRNRLADPNAVSGKHAPRAAPAAAGDPCTSGAMTATSTNLHFHGLTIRPVCHEDDVRQTSIQASDAPFEYRFRVPAAEPPGLYWYHPHIHGFSAAQVGGGASGALIVEGLERAVPEVAGLAERVLIIRDQLLQHPDAPPSASEPAAPAERLDNDGDSANTGTGFGRPARDLSVNFVPVPYPDYPPASIRMRPGERELWRVLNASSITYLDLTLHYGAAAQALGIVAIDGVPLNHSGPTAERIRSVDHLELPPGGRVEVIVTGPPRGVDGSLLTRWVDTGIGGENDPNRVLAAITTTTRVQPSQPALPAVTTPLPQPTLAWLGSVAAVRVRKLFFSQTEPDPAKPGAPTTFFITVDGETPAAFDPSATAPNIVVHQGEVEDWIIENRSTELHAFHIHQLHFLMVEATDQPEGESFLRDTVNVPYADPHVPQYPSVRLRMDFRDPSIVGTFMYHCHLLEHGDGGMMGTIQVLPRSEQSTVDAARTAGER